MNYFELFDLPASPFINFATLNQKYIELQRQFHPDNFTNENEAALEEAEEKSAMANKAYAVFKDKNKTLGYFLETNNIIAPDEKYELPKDFLMEVMELNEFLEDDKDGRKKIEQFERDIEVQIEPLKTKASFTEADLALLKLFYYQKKYLQRILERLTD
jgi:molecular chaperone HscB